MLSAIEKQATQNDCMLVVRCNERTFAIPIEYVIETMRPLPIVDMPNKPSFVLGVSILRGKPTPVVDLCSLLGFEQTKDSSRFVLLRVGQRQVALLAGTVLGIESLSKQTLHDLPQLFAEANQEALSILGVRDHELMVVVQNMQFLPEDVWDEMHQEDRPT